MNSTSNAPQVIFIPLLDTAKIILLDAMLLELQFHQRQRELCAIHRDIEFIEHIRRSADMILMAMGQHETFDFALVLSRYVISGMT